MSNNTQQENILHFNKNRNAFFGPTLRPIVTQAVTNAGVSSENSEKVVSEIEKELSLVVVSKLKELFKDIGTRMVNFFSDDDL